jgi:alpha-glucosidase
MQQTNWPLGSIVYQIYPRSFKDSNGDGVGDLPGILQKVDYLAELGINAIWLSPIYPSPQADFGYDIADFTDIDPMFGTLSDFDQLVDALHKRGIKIMMDYVPNHTSSAHPWFQESRSSITNPKRDWYIWADGKEDGSPPNNWLSNFGGSAWTLDPMTHQYYYHAFDKEQPDLNWRNPNVVTAMLDVLRFWMDKGVDGFRVDAVYFLFEDPTLADEAPNPNWVMATHSEHDSLIHDKTFALPETLAMMKRFTEVLQEYEDKCMVTEVYAGLPQLIQMYQTIGWRWYAPFNFSFITLPWKAELHKAFIDEYDKALGNLYLPSYVLGNHDQHRVASRIGEAQARIAAMALFTLRGLPFVYYGDELGMTDTHIPPDQVKDTYELNSPGLGLGRDPERTPMQWSNADHAGFTDGEPWLPVNENCKTINVTQEETEPASMLSLYKLLIKLKKHNPALRDGTYVPVDAKVANVLVYIRQTETEKVLVLLNFDERDKKITLDFPEARVLCSASMTVAEGEKIKLTNYTLKGNEGLVLQL